MTAPTQNRHLLSLHRLARLRGLRDSLTGYLFILPAFLIIFLFGLFPILFSVYVSLHNWRIRQDVYIGLDNFSRAIGGLAYVIGFWIVILLIYIVYKNIRQLSAQIKEGQPQLWLYALPALIFTGAIAQFLVFATRLLPEVLNIADKVRGVETNQALFVSFLSEAWREASVQEAWGYTVLFFMIGLVVLLGVYYLLGRHNKQLQFAGSFTLLFVYIGIAAGLGWLTWTEIEKKYAMALEAGVELDTWTQIITISAGFVLLLLSWLLWRSGIRQSSNVGMVLKLAAAVMLIVGAWALIGEIPNVIASGDKKWWQSLLVTVYYSVGTVPLQLSISLFVAVLLFQDIKGRAMFRLIYFLPYITPAVAAAAVFRVLFSSRPNAPVNTVFTFFDLPRQLWLDEPKGIFQVLFGPDIPSWLVGPSLALVVIIIYNIWSYVGYDIVIFLAGLGGIPGELYEAAEIDGAGKWGQFRHITLPLLSPTTYFLTLLSVIGTFKAFNHVWVLRKAAALGTTDTASIVIFTEFNRNTRYGYAASLALILFIVILILTVINNKIAEERVFYG